MLATFSALSEPNRLRIVELLRSGPQPVGAISDSLSLRQPQVSKHLRLLKEAGLVDVRPLAQQRVYQLCPTRFRELHAWLEQYRSLWDERFAGLEQVIEELKQKREQEKQGHGRTRK